MSQEIELNFKVKEHLRKMSTKKPSSNEARTFWVWNEISDNNPKNIRAEHAWWKWMRHRTIFSHSNCRPLPVFTFNYHHWRSRTGEKSSYRHNILNFISSFRSSSLSARTHRHRHHHHQTESNFPPSLSLECVSFSKVLNIFSKFISPIKKTFLTESTKTTTTSTHSRRESSLLLWAAKISFHCQQCNREESRVSTKLFLCVFFASRCCCCSFLPSALFCL